MDLVVGSLPCHDPDSLHEDMLRAEGPLDHSHPVHGAGNLLLLLIRIRHAVGSYHLCRGQVDDPGSYWGFCPA